MPSPLSTKYILPLCVAALCLAASATGSAAPRTAEKPAATHKASHPPIHPKVFEKIQCWVSDTEEPVVTEINLDAVERNRNEYDKDEVTQEGQVVTWRSNDEKVEGFLEYRILPAAPGHHLIAFSDNGGGTFTSKTYIGFSIQTRTILKNGKRTEIRVLRVETISDKPPTAHAQAAL